METGSGTHQFSLNNQYRFFLLTLSILPLYLYTLGMELPALSSLFSAAFEFLLRQAVQHRFRGTDGKYDNYAT